MQNAKTWYEFNRIKLFLQKLIFWLALSFSCNRMRLSHVNFTFIILCKFLAFSCGIFPNTNLVQIILSQSLDRFGAVAFGKLFYGESYGCHNWEDSVYRYGKAWMYQIYFYSKPDKFLLWLSNWLFKIYNNKTTLSETVSKKFCFLQS